MYMIYTFMRAALRDKVVRSVEVEPIIIKILFSIAIITVGIRDYVRIEVRDVCT